MTTINSLEKGLFLCSIDTELAWGSAHRDIDPTTYQHWESYGRVRDSVERLLALMDRYDIRATWAFVGRLLIDPRDDAENALYPENPQPARKHLVNERTAEPEFLSKWYTPELLQMVQNAGASHEIGTHTFSHAVAGEPGYSKELLQQELTAATKQAEHLGISLKTLIYPKNRTAHTEILADHGISAYRTVPESRISKLPPVLRGVAHRVDAYLPVPVDISYPELDGDTWVLPASYYYRHTGGWARWQSNLVRRAKLRSGLRRAAKNGGLFHIWFHPYDIASDPDRLLKPLEAAFKEVSTLRDKGLLDNLTLGETAQMLQDAQTEAPEREHPRPQVQPGKTGAERSVSA